MATKEPVSRVSAVCSICGGYIALYNAVVESFVIKTEITIQEREAAQ